MAVVPKLRITADDIVGTLNDKVRDHVVLDGALDGSNRVFTIPNGEKALHSLTGGFKVKPYHGTRRLLTAEFVVEESGGVGTGYDQIRFLYFAPKPTGRVFADFVIE